MIGIGFALVVLAIIAVMVVVLVIIGRRGDQ